MRVLLSLALLFPSFAFAEGIGIDIAPARPIVIDSTMTMIDGTGTLLMGRWFATSFYIKNTFDVPVVIESIDFHMKSAEGTATTKSFAMTPQEVQPGESLIYTRQYIDGVPDSASFEYEMSAEVKGYKGTISSVGEKIIGVKFFKTQ